MKIKRTKNLLYIASSVMVLGLALMSFDTAPSKQTGSLQTPAPTKPADQNTTPAPTQAPNHTATPSPSPTPTSTPTPTPTPTPSLAQLNAQIAIQPATDDFGTGLTTVITDYLNTLYSDENSQVKELENITCYYKPGVNENDYYVYAAYDIHYEGSNVPIPTLDEYVVSFVDGAATVVTENLDDNTKEALLLSRGSESVAALHIRELLRCYMNAKLAVDEPLLSSLVTDPSYIKIKDIEAQTQYIEEYKNLEFIIKPVPDNVEEFDYIVYVVNDVKIVNISTLAPGMDEYMIAVDGNNYPFVFTGITSTAGDAARIAYRESEEYLTNFNQVVDRMTNAMLQDPDLLEFMERLLGASGTTE